MPELLVLLLIVGVALILVGLWLPRLTPDPVQAYVERLAVGDQSSTLDQVELAEPFAQRVLRPILEWLASPIQRITRQKDVDGQAQRIRLTLAGNPHSWTPTAFLGMKGLSALVAAPLISIPFAAGGELSTALAAAAVAAVVGFMAPELYLSQLIRQRRKEIERAMPYTLELLGICLEAGLGLDSALMRVCAKSNNALTREFSRLLYELRLGRPRRQALKEVIVRTEVPDLANFISAVIQADDLGVSVTRVIAVLTDQMRTIQRQRAEEEAAMAPVKMLIPMVIFFFPAVCVVTVGPIWPMLSGFGAK